MHIPTSQPPLPPKKGRPLCITNEAELDAKLFAHIHFDHRLTGSTLVGDTFNRTTYYILKMLEFMIAHKQEIGISNDKWIRIEKALEQGRKEFTTLVALEQEIHTKRKEAEDYSKKKEREALNLNTLRFSYIFPIAREALSTLERDHVVTIPGGWAGAPGGKGHAMIYKLIKEADGSYTFMVFNTGVGIEYHLKKSVIKDKYSPLMAYKIPPSKNIDKKLLSFIEELIAPEIKPVVERVSDVEYQGEKWKTERQYDATRIYQEVIPQVLQLGAEPVDPENYTRMTTQGQLAGTCSMRVLMPVLQVLMQGDSEAFQQLLNQLRLQSIVDHFHIQKAKGNLHDKEFRKNILDAIGKEARFAERLMQRTIDGHPAISKELLDEMLNDIFPTINKELATTPKTSAEIKETKEFSGELTNATFDLWVETEKEQASKKEKTLPESAPLAKRSMPAIGNLREYPSPLAFLKASYEVCLHNDKLGQSETVLDELEKWFFSLPLDLKSASEYWSQLKPIEAKEALSYLQFIQRTYGKYCFAAGGYPLARQTINSQITQLTGGFIFNQLFNNPSFRSHYDISTSRTLSRDTYGVTWDPLYDKRANELEKLRLDLLDTKEAIAKSESGKKQAFSDNFDLDFLEHYLDKTVLQELTHLRDIRENDDAMSGLDNARINLYHLMRNPKLLERASDTLKKVIKDYDTYLEYQQLNQESELFFGSNMQSGLDYFENVNLKGDEQASRMNDRNVELSKTKNSEIVNIGDYKTKHQFSHKSLVKYREGKTLSAFLQIERNDIDNLLFSSGGESNQRLIESLSLQASQKAKTSLYQRTVSEEQRSSSTSTLPSHALGFTRHLNDEMRLLTTIDFFESNLELLEDPDCQKLLLMNLLTPNLLTNRIKKDPHFTKTLMTFYEKCLNYYTQNRTITSAGIFCFELGHYLLKYLEDLSNVNVVSESITLLQEKNKKLTEYLKHYSKEKNLSQTFKDLLNIYFLNLSLDKPRIYSAEELNFLFKTLLIKALVPDKTENKLLEYEKLSCLARIKPLLQASFIKLSQDEQEKLIKEVLSDLLPDYISQDARIRIAYPTIQIDYPHKKSLKIDFSRGEMIPRIGPLPNVVLQNYQNILGTKLKQAFILEKENSKIYEFYDEEKKTTYQIEVKNNNFNNTELRMMPPNQSRWYSIGSSSELLERNIPLRLQRPDAQGWTSIDTPISYYYTDAQNNKPLAKIELVPSPEGTKGDLQPCKVLELTSEGLETGYSLVPKITSDMERLDQFLNRFEKDSLMIEIWQAKDPTNEVPYKIKLPRYNLEWKAHKTKDNKIEYLWQENSDFRLIMTDKEPILGFPHGLYMENVKTNEIHCIIPKQQFYIAGSESFEGHYYKLNYDLPTDDSSEGRVSKKDCKNRFSNEFPNVRVDLSIPLPWQILGKEQYCQYKIVNNKLEGNQTTDYLQLAYIALAKREPMEAMRALRACERLGGLRGSIQEVDLIKKIMTGIPSQVIKPELYKDARIDDPETDAVRLYAAWLLIEQKRLSFNKPYDFNLEKILAEKEKVLDYKQYKTGNLYYAEKIKEEVAEFYTKDFELALRETYSNYYKRIGNMDASMQLNSEKETSLLRALTYNRPHTLAIQNRMQELTAITLTKEMNQLKKTVQQLLHEKGKPISPPIPPEILLEAKKIEERIQTIKVEIKKMNMFQKRLQVYSRGVVPLLPPRNLHNHPFSNNMIKYDSLSEDKIYEMLEESLFKPEPFISHFNSIFNLACKKDKKLAEYLYQMLKTEALQPIPMDPKKGYFYELLHLLGYVYEFPENFISDKPASSRLQQLSELSLELSKTRKPPKILITSLVTRTEPLLKEVSAHLEEVSTKTISPPLPESEYFRWMPIEKVNNPNMVLANELGERDLLRDVELLSKITKKEQDELIANFKKAEALKTPDDQDKFLVKQKRRFELDLAIGGKLNSERLEQNKIYHQYLSDPEKQLKMKNTLDAKIEQEKLELEKIEKELAQTSTLALLGTGATIQTQLQVLGKKQPLITEPKDEALDKTKPKQEEDLPKLPHELIWLYLQGDQELFRQKTRLNSSDATKLYQNIHAYLLKFSEHQRRMRTSKLLDAAISSENKKSAEYNGLIEQLGEQFTASRCFDAEANPEMLVFECLDNKLIRPDQGKTLQRLTTKIITKNDEIAYRNEIEQKIMGAGKTILLLPLLALKKATGRNLSMVVIPLKLLANNLNDIRSLTKKLFGKSGYPFLFDRDTDCSIFHLQSMYEKLQEVIVNREYVLTTPESIESLQLKYIELLDKESLSIEEEKAVLALENILNLIQKQGDALIDECDTSLDPKNELNYTQGQIQNVSADLFKNILMIYRFLDKVELGVAPEKYTLKQVMMGQKGIPTEIEWDKALEALTRNLIDHKDGILNPVAVRLTVEQKTLLLRYIMNDNLSEIPDFVLSSENKEVIGLVKGEIGLFRHCLKNKFNEHYGFPKSPDFEGSREIAIPYAANNTPNERSQFGSIYEIINYSIQAQKQKERLSLPLIYQLVADFQTMASYEVMNSLGKVSIENTQVGLVFEKLTHKKLNIIDLNNELQMQTLQKEFTENEEVNDYVLQKYVLPDIKQYASVQRANGINHVEQYRSAQGFSGTPWNVRCYHQRFDFNEEEGLGIDGKTIDLLIKKNTAVKICSSNNTQTIIQDTVIKHPETQDIQAFIDIGALFKGKDNEMIAREFAEQLSNRPNNKIRHVLYYNDKNILCALPLQETAKLAIVGKETKETQEAKETKLKPIVIGSTSPEVIYQKTGSRPEQYFTYYDQQHTTGADIKQKPNAIGITSIDIDTKARDLWQGAMRFRDFPRGQRVEVVLSQSAASTKPKDAIWNIKNVISLVQLNQDNILTDLHLRSHLDKMNNIIRKNLFGRIVKCDNVALKRKLRKDFAKVFEVSLLASPFQEFKDVETLRRTEKILQKHLEDSLSNFKELIAKANIVVINEEVEDIKKELLDIYNKGLLYCKNSYKQAAMGLNEGRIIQAQSEKQRERQKEVSKEIKKEKETERQTQNYLEKARANPLPYLSWKTSFPMVLKKGDYAINSLEKIHVQSLNDMVATSFAAPWRFQENIFVSENYANTYRGQTNKLDPFLKPLNFFLLIKEPGTDDLKAMLITQEEALEFSRYIDAHKTEMKKTGPEAWIMTPHNHWLNGTSANIEPRNYPILLEQIRFFNADLDMYTSDTQIDWLFEETQEKLEYLENVILVNYPEKEKFLRSFKNTLNSIHEDLLKIISKIDKSQLKKAIDARDIKAFTEALTQFKAALNVLSNKGICSQVLSRTLPGEKTSLLGLAIQAKEPKIVESLLKETELLPKITFSEKEPPLLQALHHYQVDIFRLIALDARVYPNKDNKMAWIKLLTEILKSKEDNAVHLVLEQAKRIINPGQYENILRTIIQEMKYDNNTVKTLTRLEPFYDKPLEKRNPWRDYLDEISKLSENHSSMMSAIQNLDLGAPPSDKQKRTEYFLKVQEALRKNESLSLKIQKDSKLKKLLDNIQTAFETFEIQFDEEYHKKYAILHKLGERTVWRDFILYAPDFVFKDTKTKDELLTLIIQWQNNPPNPTIAAYFQNRFSDYPPTLLLDVYRKDPNFYFQLSNNPKFAILPHDHHSWINLIKNSSHNSSIFQKVIDLIKTNLKNMSENTKENLLEQPELKNAFLNVLHYHFAEEIERLLSFMEIYPSYTQLDVWQNIIDRFSHDEALRSSIKMQDKLISFFKTTLQTVSEASKDKDRIQILNNISSLFLKMGRLESLNNLIKDIDFNKPDYLLWGQSLLKDAIQLNHWALVESMLNRGIRVQEPKVLNDILKWAVLNSKYSMAENMLKQNANINMNIQISLPSSFYDYYRPARQIDAPIIFWAISKLDAKMVSILINSGADCSQAKFNNQNALEAILALPAEKVAEILLILSPIGIKNLYENPNAAKMIFKWAGKTASLKKMNEAQLKVLEWILGMQTKDTLIKTHDIYHHENRDSFEEACRIKDWARVKILLKALGDKDADKIKEDLKSIEEYVENATINNKADTINALLSLGYTQNDRNRDQIHTIYLKACENGAMEVIQTLFRDKETMEILLQKNPAVLNLVIKQKHTKLKDFLFEKYQIYKDNPIIPIKIDPLVLITAMEVNDTGTVSKLINQFNIKPTTEVIDLAIKSSNLEMLSLFLITNENKDSALKDAFEFRKDLEDKDKIAGTETLGKDGKPIPKPQMTEGQKREKEYQITQLNKTIFWLIEQGAGDESLLKEAIKNQFLDIVKKLTESKAFMEKMSVNKEAFLLNAITQRDTDLAIFFIDILGASDKEVFFAAIRDPNSSSTIVRAMLKKHKALYINARNNEGFSALYLAIEANNEEIVKLLLAEGFDPNEIGMLLDQKTKADTTPIFTPYFKYSAWPVDDFGYEPDIIGSAVVKQSASFTPLYMPLMRAIQMGSFNIVKMLVEAGASLTATNDSNETALMLAKKLAENLADIANAASQPASSTTSTTASTAVTPPPSDETSTGSIETTDDLFLLSIPNAPTSTPLPTEKSAQENMMKIVDYLSEAVKKLPIPVPSEPPTPEKPSVIFSSQGSKALTSPPASPEATTTKGPETPSKPTPSSP